ncbi:MAG: 2-amino-4-hydroxy-6-hydroxymethyldihydropteridine diphosphokinase [Gammaproteobacteria bacterium]|nr:2-amino-4-hydroxy-6-hydroxymethyldihydropteridine diphosphokinase [Gammaproteobacteria bacterium]
MATVYVGLGSNIDPEKNLRLGLRELRDRFGELQTSAVYRSKAIGFEGDDFLNLVVSFESHSSPLEICDAIELIHNLSGRDRDGGKWESRPLDIDLLLYNDLVVDERPVCVPRRDVLEYSFVLRPLAELAPDLVHPVTGRTMQEHWRNFDQASHPLGIVDVIF